MSTEWRWERRRKQWWRVNKTNDIRDGPYTQADYERRQFREDELEGQTWSDDGVVDRI